MMLCRARERLTLSRSIPTVRKRESTNTIMIQSLGLLLFRDFRSYIVRVEDDASSSTLDGVVLDIVETLTSERNGGDVVTRSAVGSSSMSSAVEVRGKERVRGLSRMQRHSKCWLIHEELNMLVQSFPFVYERQSSSSVAKPENARICFPGASRYVLEQSFAVFSSFRYRYKRNDLGVESAGDGSE